MTTQQMVERAMVRVGEVAGASGFYSVDDATNALNEAQNLFCFLTLALEATGTLVISSAQCLYDMRAQPGFSGWIVPLDVRVFVTQRKVNPSRLGSFAARNPRWSATAGTPTEYATIGFGTIAVTPQATMLLSVRYARTPAQMVPGGQAPELPDHLHPHLVDFAVARLVLNQGGQQLSRAAGLVEAFIAAARLYGDYVRSKSKDRLYDTMPFELTRYDVSGLLSAMQAKRATSGLNA